MRFGVGYDCLVTVVPGEPLRGCGGLERSSGVAAALALERFGRRQPECAAASPSITRGCQSPAVARARKNRVSKRRVTWKWAATAPVVVSTAGSSPSPASVKQFGKRAVATVRAASAKASSASATDRSLLESRSPRWFREWPRCAPRHRHIGAADEIMGPSGRSGRRERPMRRRPKSLPRLRSTISNSGGAPGGSRTTTRVAAGSARHSLAAPRPGQGKEKGRRDQAGGLDLTLNWGLHAADVFLAFSR